jgi:glycosyltransferase involved in cell wall biosynthesis
MKVLHVIGHLDNGGAETLLAQSLIYYPKKFVSIDLLILKDNNSFLLNSIKNKFTGNVFKLTKDSIYDLRLIFKIMPYLSKYDIIHVHLFPSLYFVVIAHFFVFKKKIIFYTEHSTENKRRNNILFKYFDRVIYKRVDRIICISNAVRENLISHLGTDTDKIIVINNGINLELFSSDVVSSFDFFNRKSFIVTQISRFSKSKDQETLIRSLMYLPKEIKLMLVGSGDLRLKSERLVSKLNLSDRVIFLGNRSDVPEIISYSSVIVQSSFYEGFGLSALEGMASEKPVIGSNVSGLNELLLDAGLLFECGNDLELSALIFKLYTDNDFYNNVARKCFLKSREYSIEKMVFEYCKEYKSLVK